MRVAVLMVLLRGCEAHPDLAARVSIRNGMADRLCAIGHAGFTGNKESHWAFLIN